MSLVDFLRESLPKILSGRSVIERWRNKHLFIIAAQNANTGSQWARLVQSGQVKPHEIVWFFSPRSGGRRKWIACFFKRSKKIIVMDRSWFNWFERNLPPKNGWKLEYGKPQVQDAIGPSLV